MPTASEIAKHLDGEVVGDGDVVLNSFATADRAQPGDLTFAENEVFFARAEESAATAIIADARFSSTKKILIRVPNARIAFAKALALFFPEPVKPVGIHPQSVVAASASASTPARPLVRTVLVMCWTTAFTARFRRSAMLSLTTTWRSVPT